MQLVYLLTWFALMVILLTSNPSMGGILNRLLFCSALKDLEFNGIWFP